MRKPMLQCGVVLMAIACSADPAPPAWPDGARAELAAMGRLDQEVRAGFGPDKLADTVYMQRMVRTDSAHTRRLAVMIDAWGWPTIASAGDSAVHAAFLIVQHSPDLDFQKRLLPELESAAARGEVPPADAAMLLDRILARNGRPQRYGTQFSMVNDTLVMDPVENVDALDSLRASVGMPSIAEYRTMLERAYGAAVREVGRQ